MLRWPFLVALFVAAFFDRNIGDAHPDPSGRQLEYEVARLETLLAHLAPAPKEVAPWSARFRVELDLAETRCRLALAEGRSMDVATAPLRKIIARYEGADESLAAKIAFDQARLRLAKAQGNAKDRDAILGELRTDVEEATVRMETAKRIWCMAREDRLSGQITLSIVQVRLAAAEEKDAQVIDGLMEIVQLNGRRAEYMAASHQADARLQLDAAIFWIRSKKK